MNKTNTNVSKLKESKLAKCYPATQGKIILLVLAFGLLFFANASFAQTTNQYNNKEVKTKKGKQSEVEVESANPKNLNRGITPVIVILPKQKGKEKSGKG